MRCLYCGHDYPDLSEHLASDEACRRAQYVGDMPPRTVTETESYRLLFYETPARGGLYELDQYRYFVLVDRQTEEPVMNFQASYSARMDGAGWAPGSWSGARQVEFAPDGGALLVFDDDVEEARLMPFATKVGAPPDAFPDWPTALRAAVAHFGPFGWSRGGWQSGLNNAPLIEPAAGHTTNVCRALPQQYHLAWVDIDWAAGTMRFADNDQREGEDVEVHRVTLPEDWLRSLRSVRWP